MVNVHMINNSAVAQTNPSALPGHKAAFWLLEQLHDPNSFWKPWLGTSEVHVYGNVGPAYALHPPQHRLQDFVLFSPSFLLVIWDKSLTPVTFCIRNSA